MIVEWIKDIIYYLICMFYALTVQWDNTDLLKAKLKVYDISILFLEQVCGLESFSAVLKLAMFISVYSRKKAHPVTLKKSHCNLQGPQTRGQDKSKFNKNTTWFGHYNWQLEQKTKLFRVYPKILVLIF